MGGPSTRSGYVLGGVVEEKNIESLPGRQAGEGWGFVKAMIGLPIGLFGK